MKRSSLPGLSYEVAVVVIAVWLPILTLSLRDDEFDFWVDVGTGSAHLFAVVCLVHFMSKGSEINKEWLRQHAVCRAFRWRDVVDGLGLALVWVCLANAWLYIAVNTGIWGKLNDMWQPPRVRSDVGTHELSLLSVVIEVLAIYPEELLCRWYLIPRLSKMFGLTVAILLSAFLFALPHMGFGLNACVTSLIYGILAGSWFAWRRRLSGMIMGHLLTNIWFGY